MDYEKMWKELKENLAKNKTLDQKTLKIVIASMTIIEANESN